MKIEITKHSRIIVDWEYSWVDKWDTFTKIGNIFQDDRSCFTFDELELEKISYKTI